MAMNMINRLKIIRENLETKGYKQDIPENIFIHAIMIVEGFNYKTAEKWYHNFIDVGLLEFKDYKVSFVDSK